MIRYDTTVAEMRDRIDQLSPTWRDRALVRTDVYRNAGRYVSTHNGKKLGNFWSDIKRLFMELQHFKCAFCERRLEMDDLVGELEYDVEHFRPKNGATRWPTRTSADGGPDFGFDVGDPLKPAYWLLAYHFLNYSAWVCRG